MRRGAPYVRCALLFTLLSLPAGLGAQSLEGHGAGDGGSARVATAALRTGAIEIDGRIDEAAWTAAPPAGGFIQLEPIEGAPAGEPSEVRLLYDAEAIYVAAMLYEDDPDDIVRRLVRRDAEGEFDFFGVLLDPDDDNRTGYGFYVNAAGVQADVYLYDDVEKDLSWNAVWESETALVPDGWTVEMRIPLSQLRYEPSDAPQHWGVNYARRRTASNELAFFAPESKSRHGKVSVFAPLVGLKLPDAARRIEARPYVLARARTGGEQPDDPFYDGSEAGAAIGGDFRIGLGGAFTLDATVNPDFGQVEVDPAVINLSANETFYPEKRPFFVEDARVFDFSLAGMRNSLFYSRRIGRAPHGVAGNADFADVPDQVPILAAAKITGRTAGLSLGALAAITRETEARAYFAGDDSTATIVVEPRTWHGVLRAQQDFRDGETVIGGIATALTRELPASGTFDFLTRRAYSAGIDFEHTWDDRGWALSGFLAGSVVQGPPAAMVRLQRSPNHYYQRPGAPDLEVDSAAQSMAGVEWRLELQRQSGEHWTGGVWLGERTAGFEINDLGFVQGGERLDAGARIAYHENTPGDVLRSYRFSLFTFHNWRHEALRDPFSAASWAHAHKNASIWGNAGVTFLNYWGMNLRVSTNPSLLDDGLTRGGPLVRQPAKWSFNLRANTDQRKALAFQPSVEIGTGEAERSMTLALQTTIRPSPRIRLEIQPRYSRESNDLQYLATTPDLGFAPTFGRGYLFGEIDRESLSLETRLDVTFTRRLTLQLFAQPLLSAGEYAGYRRLARAASGEFVSIDDRTTTFDDREYVDFDGDGVSDFDFREPDFDVRSLRGNAVLRWEYRPGSTIFLVWQQQRAYRGTDAAAFSLRDGAGELLDLPAENLFIVKVSHWLGL